MRSLKYCNFLGQIMENFWDPGLNGKLKLYRRLGKILNKVEICDFKKGFCNVVTEIKNRFSKNVFASIFPQCHWVVTPKKMICHWRRNFVAQIWVYNIAFAIFWLAGAIFWLAGRLVDANVMSMSTSYQCPCQCQCQCSCRCQLTCNVHVSVNLT